MADLDVTDVLSDSMFTNSFVVERRAQTVGSDGRTTEATTLLNLVGVITAGSVSPIGQAPEAVYARDSITVHCTTRLYGPKETTFPDVVRWSGNRYLVKRVFDWAKFGTGFYAAEAEMLELSQA